MRPRIFALLAVSAVALAGCASAEPSAEPTATVTVTATPSPTVSAAKVSKAEATGLTDEGLTQREMRALAGPVFYRTARVIAPMAGDHSKIDEMKYTDALIGYCLDGKKFNVSKVKELNKQLTTRADEKFCPMLEDQLNSR